jgi:NAD(P)-dependent dehydrogenase (short-subunit alcohol dehydrogenase family)
VTTTGEDCLADKRILVTGAARGIGRAVCKRAAERGARVFAVDLLEDELATLSDSEDPAVGTLVKDLRGVADIDSLCAQVSETLGGLDALIHVAGVIVRKADIDSITEEDWDLQCDVNLKSTFFLNRAAARIMGTQDSGGAIVNFSSQGWWTGGFGGSVTYAATKGGVVSLTRGLARTLAANGVRVNCVAPGAVDTAMMREGLDDAARASFLEQVPLGRMAEPVEVADAALFLSSSAASYITGATLNVSGGQLMY